MVCQDEDSDSDYYCLMVETITSVYQIVSKEEFRHYGFKGNFSKFQLDEPKPLGTVQLQTRKPKNAECYLIEYTVVLKGFKDFWVLKLYSSSALCQSILILTTSCLYLVMLPICQMYL